MFTASRCEMCGENPAKYKCPKCSIRTCSLPCVKHHKTERNCDGIRDKTKFVEVSKFTDIDLLSDYRFLEDAGRKADSANRDNFENRKRNNWQRTKLLRHCKRNNIRLMSMPYSMSKRQQNKSRVHYETQSIIWMMEWNFPNAEAKYFDTFSDKCLLSTCLKKFIDPVESDPVIRHTLKPYVADGTDHVNVFMKVEGLQANCIRYYEFDKEKSLSDNLEGKLVVEFPTVYVVLSDKADQFTLLRDGEEQQLAEFQKIVASCAENPECQFSHDNQRGVKRHRGYRMRQRRRGGSTQPQN
ncbi:hypothetical protein LSH36_387g00041 [Paralvinella palmiformis]|uniref:Box C/D snoRNA protein 1 n=1 Tax=Paralvinella palmiformis TaxID=53620 RepID=A0AAD9MYT2_9ANNE|nr:hypothetical protein LSH36_387g00041 [Paralvinella palmiformis]